MKTELKLLDTRLANIEGGAASYATPGSAAIDLRACRTKQCDGDFASFETPFALLPGEKCAIGAGIAIHIGGMSEDDGGFLDRGEPSLGFAGLVLPRSGLGSKLDVVLANLVGLLDEDYQGEIIMTLKNNGTEPFMVDPLDRIAQFFIVPVIRPTFQVVENFSANTVRGACGFGSTGVK